MAHPRGRFQPARVIARQDAGGGLTRITVAAEREVVATYDSPGQYIEVRVDEQTGFFVLANEPDAPHWELILRAGGGASDVLLTLALDAPLEVTAAIGAGFPMLEVPRQPLIVALGGTGIAAGRPIVARRIREGDATHTTVLVGMRTRAELPMRSELEAWRLSGVDVLVCLSKVDDSIDGLPYANGYIQDVLRLSRPTRLPPGSHIFAVGAGSMIEALRSLAVESGIPRERVHTNH